MRRRFLGYSLILAVEASSAFALPFATGRGGPSYSYLSGSGSSNSSTYAFGGRARFGYELDETHIFLAADVTALRIHKNSRLSADVDNNNLMAVLGYSFEKTTWWVAGGAGELRTYDRKEEEGRPYRYYVTEQQFGFSYQIYSADYARVELGLDYDRLNPDDDFRLKYRVKRVDSLQFDVGFKLLNW